MEEVVTDKNRVRAREAVKRNRGSAGPAGGHLRSKPCEAGRDTEAERGHADVKDWVVDFDVTNSFDHVNHDILMGRVAQVIRDKKPVKRARRKAGRCHPYWPTSIARPNAESRIQFAWGVASSISFHKIIF